MVKVKSDNCAKRVALFGGTFDPIHLGHLIIAQMVIESMSLDQVIFVPSCTPPHKNTKQLFSAEDRLNMVRLAVRGNPQFLVSDVEYKRGGKSYSIDTVRYYRQILSKKTKLFFIVGGDALHTLNTWKEIDELRKQVEFVCVNRPGYVGDEEKDEYHSVTIQGIDISSTQIRQRIVQGKRIQYLVPEAVLRYIERHHLIKG